MLREREVKLVMLEEKKKKQENRSIRADLFTFSGFPIPGEVLPSKTIYKALQMMMMLMIRWWINFPAFRSVLWGFGVVWLALVNQLVCGGG